MKCSNILVQNSILAECDRNRMLFIFFFLSKKLLMLSIAGEPYLFYILLGFLLCCSFLLSNSFLKKEHRRA